MRGIADSSEKRAVAPPGRHFHQAPPFVCSLEIENQEFQPSGGNPQQRPDSPRRTSVQRHTPCRHEQLRGNPDRTFLRSFLEDQ